jgi:hypothetical protein
VFPFSEAIWRSGKTSGLRPHPLRKPKELAGSVRTPPENPEKVRRTPITHSLSADPPARRLLLWVAIRGRSFIFTV